MAVLRVKGVKKAYKNHIAIRDIDLEVPRKSIFGLLGPNGAGKTTLLRIINHITLPDEGKIYFNERLFKPEHVESIGYMPEERGLYKKMKVGEQAMYFAQLKGMHKYEAKKELDKWFKRFQIEDWWNKNIEELSKGMAQKIQFITTVLHKPKLLILDEPFSGFDPVNANLIKDEILRLRRQGTTIILSTHNMASVEEICDHIALIHKSEKIIDGPVSEIKENFREHIYNMEFTGNKIGFTNALWTGYEILDIKSRGKMRFSVRLKMLNGNSLTTLLKIVLPEIDEIHSIEEVIPSINEIFLRAVEDKSPKEDEQD